MVTILLSFQNRDLPKIKLSLRTTYKRRIVLKTIFLNIEKIGKYNYLSMTIVLDTDKLYTMKFAWKSE